MKKKLDSLERERLLQEMAAFDITPDRRRLVDDIRGGAPGSWDREVEAYRNVENGLRRLPEKPEHPARRSPLRSAFETIEARERRRAKLRREWEDRIIVGGAAAMAARAAQAVAQGVVGLTVVTRGAAQIAGTLREGMNHALLDGMLAQFPEVATIARARIVNTTAISEEEPA